MIPREDLNKIMEKACEQHFERTNSDAIRLYRAGFSAATIALLHDYNTQLLQIITELQAPSCEVPSPSDSPFVRNPANVPCSK